MRYQTFAILSSASQNSTLGHVSCVASRTSSPRRQCEQHDGSHHCGERQQQPAESRNLHRFSHDAFGLWHVTVRDVRRVFATSGGIVWRNNVPIRLR